MVRLRTVTHERLFHKVSVILFIIHIHKKIVVSMCQKDWTVSFTGQAYMPPTYSEYKYTYVYLSVTTRLVRERTRREVIVLFQQ